VDANKFEHLLVNTEGIIRRKLIFAHDPYRLVFGFKRIRIEVLVRKNKIYNFYKRLAPTNLMCRMKV